MMKRFRQGLAEFRSWLNGSSRAASTAIRPVCPYCSHTLDTPVAPSGQMIRCPKCSSEFQFGMNAAQSVQVISGIIVGALLLYLAWLMF